MDEISQLNELGISINGLSELFWKMVDLVPPKSYYPHNEFDPSLPSADGKPLKLTNWKATKAKLGPKYNNLYDIKNEVFYTVSGIHNMKVESEKEEDEEEDEEEEENKKVKMDDIPQGEVVAGFATSNEDLKAKLAQKIQELRQKRKADEKDSKKTPESKRLKQEKKNEKKEKNKKLNQIKQEKNNKRKFDQAYFEEKKAKQEALDSVQKKNENEGSNKKARLESPEDELVKNLEFGSFGAKDAKKSTKSHTLKPDKKKPKLNKAQLLQQAIENKAIVEQLKKTDVEKAKEIAWESMLSKAQGEKPKDDVAKLKKSIGKDKAKKKKSTAEWNQRTALVEKQLKDRQEKRAKNIKERNQAKIDKKMGKNKGKKGKDKKGKDKKGPKGGKGYKGKR